MSTDRARVDVMLFSSGRRTWSYSISTRRFQNIFLTCRCRIVVQHIEYHNRVSRCSATNADAAGPHHSNVADLRVCIPMKILAVEGKWRRCIFTETSGCDGSRRCSVRSLEDSRNRPKFGGVNWAIVILAANESFFIETDDI